ncbi:MAG: sulfite exporter TauE/SafE family protein [Dehalococcoidia bacterium]
MKTKSIWYLATGAGAGMLAGLLGVGGGIVMVPILVGLLSLTQHHAHGTSLAIIAPIALIGTVVYALRGDVNWVLVAAIGSGSAFGVIGGAKLMMKMPAQRLRQGFGIYTIAIAILLLLR